MSREIPEWRYARVPKNSAVACDWCDFRRAEGDEPGDRWFYHSTDGKNRVCAICFEHYLANLKREKPEDLSHINGMEWADPIAEGPPAPEFAHESQRCRFWYSGTEYGGECHRCYYRTTIDHEGVEWIEEMFPGPTMTEEGDEYRERRWKWAVEAYLGYEVQLIASEEQLDEVFPLLKEELAKRDDREYWLERLLPKREAVTA